MSDRPFKVLGLQQIAVGATNKDRLRNLWVDLFGLSLGGNYRSESENVDEDIAFLGDGPYRLEVEESELSPILRHCELRDQLKKN